MALPATIRGHQALFKVFKDGEELVIDTIKRVSVNQDSNITRHTYVGNPIPQGDQVMLGWTGSFEMEVRNSFLDDFIDALITANLDGIGVSDYTFLIREVYGDGSQATYVYTDCFFKMSREQSGLEEKIMKSVEFQASSRLKIA